MCGGGCVCWCVCGLVGVWGLVWLCVCVGGWWCVWVCGVVCCEAGAGGVYTTSLGDVAKHVSLECQTCFMRFLFLFLTSLNVD